MVDAVRAHQLVVRAPFDDAAFFHQQNEIGAADRREAIGDDEGGAPGQQRRIDA